MPTIVSGVLFLFWYPCKALVSEIGCHRNVQNYIILLQRMEQCDTKIKSFQLFIEDYEKLEEKLKTYPDKTSYDVSIALDFHCRIESTAWIHAVESTV